MVASFVAVVLSRLAIAHAARKSGAGAITAQQPGAKEAPAWGDRPAALLAVGASEGIQPPGKIAVVSAVASVALTGADAFQPATRRVLEGEAPAGHPATSEGSAAYGDKVGPLQYRNEPEERMLLDMPVTSILGAALPLVREHFDDPRLVGEGPEGFEVYTCKARGAERLLEVHVMPLRDADDRARFRGEIAAHRRDAGCYLGWRRDVNSSGGAHGLVVIQAASERLEEVPLDREPESLWSRFKVAAAISKSLLAMSKAGFVHGALDSSMVLVDRDTKGRFVKTALAHRFPAIKKGARASLEEPPLRGMGAPFIAPELRERGGKFSEKTDVYAFGAVLFDLLVGHPPDNVYMRSSDYLRLNNQFPAIGQLLRDCLSPTPSRRISLKQAAQRVQGLYGEEAMQTLDIVARDDLEGLPTLCARPPWASGALDRMCKLVR